MLLACKSWVRFSDQCANTRLLLQPGQGKTRYRVTHSHCRVTRSAQLRHPLWLVSDGHFPSFLLRPQKLQLHGAPAPTGFLRTAKPCCNHSGIAMKKLYRNHNCSYLPVRFRNPFYGIPISVLRLFPYFPTIA